MGIVHYGYCETCGLAVDLGKFGWELKYEIFKLCHINQYHQHKIKYYVEDRWEDRWDFNPPKTIDFPELPSWLWNEYKQLWNERYNVYQEKGWSQELDDAIDKSGKDIAQKYQKLLSKIMFFGDKR